MIWAEPGRKMLSAGNYDNRPTRVWAELGSKLVNDWSVILQIRGKGNKAKKKRTVWLLSYR